MDAKEEGKQYGIREGILVLWVRRVKEKFEVVEGETIDACLDRIKAAGYFPVRTDGRTHLCREESRMAKVHYVPVDRKIVFEAKLIE